MHETRSEVYPVISMPNARVFYPYAVERLTITFSDQEDPVSFVTELRACEYLAVLVGACPGASVPALSSDIFPMGTMVRVAEMERKHGGTISCEVYGLERVTIDAVVQEKPYIRARVRLKPATIETDSETEALRREVTMLAARLWAIISQKTEKHALEGMEEHLGEGAQRAVYVLAHLLIELATCNWSQGDRIPQVQIDAPLRLELLTCDSVKDKLALLKTCLASQLQVYTKALSTKANTVQPAHPAPAQPHAKALTVQPHASSIVLGRDQQEKTAITLGVDELFAGTHILGIPQHGKSALLINVFLGLAANGYGAAYVDPHGDAFTDILARLPRHRVDDVIILDPTHESSAFGLNLVSCDNVASDRAMTYAYDQLWSVFTKVWGDEEGQMGIWMEKCVSNAILTLLEHPGTTVAEIPLMLKSKAYREHFARSLKNRVVAEFWTTEFESLPKHEQRVEIESTLTRLNRLLQNPLLRRIVGQPQTTMRFREIIDSKKLLLVKIPRRLPDDFKTLLGTMLITQLQDAMFSRDDIPKHLREPFFLIVDEVERFATKEFTAFFEEGAKYRVGTIAAHQHLFQEGISSAIRGGLLTAANKVYLRVNDTDADIVAPGFAKGNEEHPIPTTIPRNVLPYLEQHSHQAVKTLWRRYIHPLTEALSKQERYKTDRYQTMQLEWVNTEETIYPEWDFGSGVRVTYEPDEVRNARTLINDLLYETQHTNAVKESLRTTVMVQMAHLLDYADYAAFLYSGRHDRFTADTYRKEIEEYEQFKNLLTSYLASNDDLMRFQYFHGFGYARAKKLFIEGDEHHRRNTTALLHDLRRWKQEPLKEPRRSLVEEAEKHRVQASRYQSLHTYLCYLMPVYQQTFERVITGTRYQLTEKVKEDRRFYRYHSRSPRHFYKPWWEKLGDWLSPGESIESEVERKLLNEKITISSNEPSIRFSVTCTVAQARAGMQNEENFLKLLVEGDGIDSERLSSERYYDRWWYQGKTPEEFTRLLTKECKEKYAFHEPRSSPEKLLATARAGLKAEIAEIAARLQPLYAKRDREVAERQALLDKKKAREKGLHDSFAAILDNALDVLMHPENAVRVPVANYDHQPRRDISPRELIDLVAGELRNLPKYEAMCKIVEERTTVIHRVSLPPLPPAQPDAVVSDMTEQIWQRMEAAYYRPKDTIDNEISQRQHLPAPESGAFVKLPGRT